MSRSFSGDPEPQRGACRRVSSARKRFPATAAATTIYHFFANYLRDTCAHAARRRPARNPVLLYSALQTSVRRRPHTSPGPLFTTPRAYSTRCYFIHLSTARGAYATLALPRRSAGVSRSTSRNRLTVYRYSAAS